MTSDTNMDNSILAQRYKMVFIGDISVGKTALMNRFISSEFINKYDPTIGVDFASKTLEFNDNIIKLQLWDSAGQEKYRSLIPSYVRGASIILIVYDVSRRGTFEGLNDWIKFIKENSSDNPLVVVVGNKIDLEREVRTEDGNKIAKDNKFFFFEVSAKNGTNVLKMFYSTIAELPFFQQLNYEDKQKLIDELIEANKTKEQNSIYDIVRGKTSAQGETLKVDGKEIKADTKKKKKCKC